MQDDDTTPGAIPSRLQAGATGRAHLSETPRKVPITDIHVPIVLMIALFSILIGGVFSVGLGWYRLSSHVTDRTVHPYRKEVVNGGGFAFKRDVDVVRSELQNELHSQYRSTRKLLIEMRIDCERKRRGRLECTVVLPE